MESFIFMIAKIINFLYLYLNWMYKYTKTLPMYRTKLSYTQENFVKRKLKGICKKKHNKVLVNF